MFTTLIVCYDNWNTLSEVPYIIKKGGSAVHILCSQNSWVKRNSFYDKWITAKDSEEGFIQQLLYLASHKNYDWIILGDEKIIRLMNERITEEATFKKILPLAKIENRELLSSKNGFYNVCKKYNILTPQSVSYKNSYKEMADFSALQFPLLVKIDYSWGGIGMKILENNQDLKTALANVPKGESALVQEYIAGVEVPVEALFWKGKLMTFTCCEILEYDKDQFSYSTRRKYFPPDEMLKEAVENFGTNVGLHGFVNMAFIKSNTDDHYYIIEADTRPNSWSAYARYAGGNFSEMIKTITSPNFTPKKVIPKTVEIALFHKDLRRSFYKHDVNGVLRWIFNYNYWKFIPFYDIKLLGYTISELWKEFFIEKMQRTFTLK